MKHCQGLIEITIDAVSPSDLAAALISPALVLPLNAFGPTCYAFIGSPTCYTFIGRNISVDGLGVTK